jgi:hypothetical protein
MSSEWVTNNRKPVEGPALLGMAWLAATEVILWTNAPDWLSETPHSLQQYPTNIWASHLDMWIIFFRAVSHWDQALLRIAFFYWIKKLRDWLQACSHIEACLQLPRNGLAGPGDGGMGSPRGEPGELKGGDLSQMSLTFGSQNISLKLSGS